MVRYQLKNYREKVGDVLYMQTDCIIDSLQTKYKMLQEKYGLDVLNERKDVNLLIKKSICKFLKQCSIPAIWCYGRHTKMMMSDFMFEFKDVYYIIDNGIKNKEESGFEIINQNSIEEKNIDGIIISSRIHRDEIIKTIRSKYSHIQYLDIYSELEQAGIKIDVSYYSIGHPYIRYSLINKRQRFFLKAKDKVSCVLELKKIIGMYIDIKDFQSAIKYARKMLKLSHSIEAEDLLDQLKDIYELQLEILKKIHENNVLVLCIDGLRRKEISIEYLNNLLVFLNKHTYYFTNAYSVSTSTFESLIPAYSENDNLKTKYYQMNKIKSNNCRFIMTAKKQNRKIVFYTDGADYIEDDKIRVKSQSQTATEKLWDFIIDAIEEKNGLFYIHILYESHYSYPNPYTAEEIVADGTNIMFDYLEHNGGQIRTDYNTQQKDALKYIDDVIVPLIEKLQCRMVLFADHGNILIDRGMPLESIEKTKFTFHEDLIQVPLAIKSPEMEVKKDTGINSIMELNNIIISLMEKKRVELKKKDYIKVVRSEIYNPDFKYLYKKVDNEQGLLAFEVFIFRDGYKLAVYADGTVELYLAETDTEVHDVLIRKRLWEKIKNKITVCDEQKI